MNAIGVIRKAIKLPVKDEKLFLQAILLVLSPFSLLVLLHYVVAGPLMQKVEDRCENSSLDPKEVWTLVGIEIPFLIAFSLVWLFGTSITIFASAIACSEYPATDLKELLSWILPSTWKKPIITWLYLSLLMIAYTVVLLISTQLIALIGTKKASSLGIWLTGILVATTYPYFACIWTLGLVISVLEEEECCYGAKAITEAQKLIGGRKICGYFLILILVVLSIPISVLFYLTTADDDDEIGTMTRFSFIFVATVLFCLMNLFTFVAFTVFYFECKHNTREEKMGTEFGSAYSLVSAMGRDDSFLPSN